MGRLTKLCTAVAASLALAGVAVGPAFAGESSGGSSTTTSTIDAGNGTITVDYHYTYTSSAGEQTQFPVKGANVMLYKAAGWNDSGDLVLTGDFAALCEGASLDCSAITDTGRLADNDTQRDLATSLLTALATSDIAFDTQDAVIVSDGTARYVDADGEATDDVAFTGLGDALYFIRVGGQILDADAYSHLMYCNETAMFIDLKSAVSGDDVAGTVSRTVSLEPKASCTLGPDPIHVTKVWDDGDSTARPSSVDVTLYGRYTDIEGNEVVETIETQTLSADNDWTYVWSGLPDDYYEYFVQEVDVPDGYTVSYSRTDVTEESATWTVTNTSESESSTPGDSETPGTSDSDDGTTPGTSGSTGSTSASASATATSTTPAQTGANIALVALVAVSALMLGVLLIVEIRRASKKA
ncbi:Cna B-type domain-containing protein [Bifidobacterium choloepi]|uniref:Cna B-type domain-containing protein n=1 Tax=Bifidobacterium choloepi TaxID=2614131 RepID=A0A6I5MYN1_9BIFI|nr:Cna B-type domain-containing protein [Bifidobacterium choloepi]NEG69728.1 Cna B-type domain-containing protein [Bifidobacterium choloepi]